MSILQKPITPASCQAPREYIQSTRWYTRELFDLGILGEYEYFLKIDTDIIFLDKIPFHILQDMKRKGAIFGHTAEYLPKGSKTCAQGIQHAVSQFLLQEQNQTSLLEDDKLVSGGKGSFCTLSSKVQRDADAYYTNFIIGKVSFWQSPAVRKFSLFLNEFPKGFFAYRWTDQIFWHNAISLFVQEADQHVADYTGLRCMPHPSCWLSSYNFKRYGKNAWHRCDNDGYFLHPKDFRIDSSVKRAPKAELESNLSQALYKSSYQHDCSLK